MANENEKARATQEAELRKLGMEPAPEEKADESDEEDDTTEDVESEKEETKEEESEDESDDSEDDSEDESEEDDADDEDEEDEESDEDSSSRKKHIPFKVHNEMRKELREAQKKLADALEEKKALEAKLPDDFDERVNALAKELNIQDPEGLKRVAKLVREASLGQVSKLEEQLANLEKSIKQDKINAPIKDSFDKEWKSFEKDFVKEYPNATPEQIEKAQKIMEKLSRTVGIGGKSYKDDDGRELLDPYPLDYIFFKNKEKFSEIVTEKKRKSMETTRTQKISEDRGKKDDDLTLPENPTSAQLDAYNKATSKIISERDNLKVRPKLNV